MLRLFVAALMALGIGVFSLNTSPPVPAQASANALYISQSCTDTASVTFTWQGSDPSARQVWIDLSIFDNGFAPRSFIGAGPFTGSDTFFTWNGLKPSTTHYVRINQQMANGTWDSSSAWVFTTCAGTSASRPPASPAQSPNQVWLGCWQGTWSGGQGTIQSKWVFTRATATTISGTVDGFIIETGVVLDTATPVTYDKVSSTAIAQFTARNGSYSQSFQMAPDGNSFTATRTVTNGGRVLNVTATRC